MAQRQGAWKSSAYQYLHHRKQYKANHIFYRFASSLGVCVVHTTDREPLSSLSSTRGETRSRNGRQGSPRSALHSRANPGLAEVMLPSLPIHVGPNGQVMEYPRDHDQSKRQILPYNDTALGKLSNPTAMRIRLSLRYPSSASQ